MRVFLLGDKSIIISLTIDKRVHITIIWIKNNNNKNIQVSIF